MTVCNACSKNVRSSGLVLAFVLGNVWRSFVSCQIFLETGSVRQKGGSGASIRILETVERVREII
jgi:hypothetical protein